MQKPRVNVHVWEEVWRRLDKIDRGLEKLGEQNVVISETLAIIAHICLYFAPVIPEAEKEAANALCNKRYESFLTSLGKRLASGSNLKELAIDAAAKQR